MLGIHTLSWTALQIMTTGTVSLSSSPSHAYSFYKLLIFKLAWKKTSEKCQYLKNNAKNLTWFPTAVGLRLVWLCVFSLTAKALCKVQMLSFSEWGHNLKPAGFRKSKNKQNTISWELQDNNDILKCQK